MDFTVESCMYSSGFPFDERQLAALGIGEGSKCWGLWIEGRRMRAKSDLNGESARWQNESPHFVVSAIHPSLWVTAFNIHALLHRRPAETGRDPERCDAMFGFLDALAECGVNVLFISTAQLGYDLISVTATCEMPCVRKAAFAILNRVDNESPRTIQERLAQSSMTKEEQTVLAAEQPISPEDELWYARVEAFKNIGLQMMPRLAALEARLIAIDELRRMADHLRTHPKESLLFGKARLKWPEFLLHVATKEMGVLLSKPPRRDVPLDDRLKIAEEVLQRAWFFNTNIVEAGENAWFLAGNSVQNRRDVESEVSREHGDTLTAEADAEALREIWSTSFHGQRSRTLGTKFRTAVQAGRSETAERIGRFETNAIASEEAGHASVGNERQQDLLSQFEAYSSRRMFEAQSLLPLRIRALTTLAYSRIWAFLGARDQGSPIEFRFTGGELVPARDKVDSEPYRRIPEFLDAMCNTSNDERGPFARKNNSEIVAVLANVNVSERSLRMRFVRGQQEKRGYITVTMHYGASEAGFSTNGSQGLVRELTRVIIDKGLRIERCSNVLLSCDVDPNTGQSKESGAVTIIARSVGRAGDILCDDIRKMLESERIEIGRQWLEMLMQTGLPKWSQNLSSDTRIEIMPGFVPDSLRDSTKGIKRS